MGNLDAFRLRHSLFPYAIKFVMFVNMVRRAVVRRGGKTSPPLY